ncbi:MAG: SIS domain-containing protein [Deltaproteobacteria bacterium]|nr:SIS domain-containing protein [Deltaproteobacteria bacterium]
MANERFKMLKKSLRFIMPYIKKTCDRLRHLDVYLARDPRYLPQGCIVFFPVMDCTLFCGLAGVLVIKGEGKDGRIMDPGQMKAFLKRVKASNIQKVLDGSIPVGKYLGGKRTLDTMERYLIELKQGQFLRYVFIHPKKAETFTVISNDINEFVVEEERVIENNASRFSSTELEKINNSFIRLKDFAWGLKNDVLANRGDISSLVPSRDTDALLQDGLDTYRVTNFLLNSLDRLEVRGRDSAGIQVTLRMDTPAEMDRVISRLKRDGLVNDFLKRSQPGELMNGSISISLDNGRSVTFTYKTASITGELGKNVRNLRNEIRSDTILHAFVEAKTSLDACIAHTRWASVGSINEANCHPVNNFTLETTVNSEGGLKVPVKDYPYYGRGSWYLDVALNGDIDNYTWLRSELEKDDNNLIDPSVTTDTKIIPLMVEKYLLAGHDLKEALRLAANDFEGSHAITMRSNLEPGKVFLALKGSGQSIYVGIGADQYVFSSEVYGLVEYTPYFIKMDGETPRVEDDPSTRGQIFILCEYKGGLDGIEAFYYDGYPLHLTEKDIVKAEITTRDIDRGNHHHFLLKEIFDAPSSVRKTLRGKYRVTGAKASKPDIVFNIGEDMVPRKLMDALKNGKITSIYIIGQGTAHVAACAIAEAMQLYLKGTSIKISGRTASDLSGFLIKDDLRDSLVIAVTQSGTTTDTNRAATMARLRGAHIIAIVNRRQSDITTKAHGVFYTSDGRDVEMAVASTKAFYSQIAAGYILALYFAHELGTISPASIVRALTYLEKAPEMMQRVIRRRDEIRESAYELARKKRYWAVVGSGANKVAADEIRIKLSELCYKTISSDIIEDKKHIDLSSEPLIIACTAGNPETVKDDIAKDISIFKAHNASVTVIAEEGDTRFSAVADSIIRVPRSFFPVSVIINTLAGHLWGYYAACSINGEAEFFRRFRNELAREMIEHNRKGISIFEAMADRKVKDMVASFSREFHRRKDQGLFATMNVGTASDITLLLKYAMGKLPLEDFWEDFKDKRTSPSPLDALDMALGLAIDELSRPVDAIRHQAKTVTVGTSRKQERLRGILFDLIEELNFSVENLGIEAGLTLKRIQRALAELRGFTLYSVYGLDDQGKTTDRTSISIVSRGGVSFSMKSRVENSGPLIGTKKTIVNTQGVYVGFGRSDRAPIVIVPILGEKHVVSYLLLCHVTFNESLSSLEKREILGEKYYNIKDLVNESNIDWDDAYLEGLPTGFLLGEPEEIIAEKIIENIR